MPSLFFRVLLAMSKHLLNHSVVLKEGVQHETIRLLFRKHNTTHGISTFLTHLGVLFTLEKNPQSGNRPELSIPFLHRLLVELRPVGGQHLGQRH